MDKRFFFSQNGTLIDYSTALDSYVSASKPFNFVANQDAFYIGSRIPFNHIYFKISFSAPPNPILSSNLIVKYYSTGNNWTSVVETIDETLGFNQSGFVTFTPNRQAGWNMASTNYGGTTIPGLSTITVYDMYWLKITVTNDLAAETLINWAGNLFSDDDDLAGEFPDFAKTTVLTSFQSGKEDWQEQAVIAGKIIAKDLVNKGVIIDKGQILNRQDYREASVMKTAEIIYRALGDDFNDQRIQCSEEYKKRLTLKIHKVDLNNNATEDVMERQQDTYFLSR